MAKKKNETVAKKKNETEAVVQGVGEEGCKLPSPSGINTWRIPLQVLVVVVYFYVLVIAFQGAVGGLEQGGIPADDSVMVPVFLGIFYSFVGASHFGAPDDFCNILPYKGAWGIWYVPGSPQFHVKWTGIAEVMSGVGLVLGSLMDLQGPYTSAGLLSDCAMYLCFLTVGMTFANIFMLTHGAKLPIKSEPLGMGFHFGRLSAQALILGLLYRLGEKSFELLGIDFGPNGGDAGNIDIE